MTRTATKPAPQTAQQAYAEKLAQTRALLADLNAIIDRHEQVGANAKDWGYTGDLGWTNQKLAEIKESMGGC